MVRGRGRGMLGDMCALQTRSTLFAFLLHLRSNDRNFILEIDGMREWFKIKRDEEVMLVIWHL
ncbi:hypothetical protein SESBI_31640 [Sesbania bispinosa]|nr:hypothetical protein SESBI_31640 [Sesbania bispinosa]